MSDKQIKITTEMNPRKLFLIDGLGALISAFLLGVVLVKLERFFGIPTATLYFLAVLPIFFAIFDYYCYNKKNTNLSLHLNIIAAINIVYCCLSIGLALYHIETVTTLGWTYIIIEILIIIVLALLELKVARRLKNNNATET